MFLFEYRIHDLSKIVMPFQCKYGLFLISYNNSWSLNNYFYSTSFPL